MAIPEAITMDGPPLLGAKLFAQADSALEEPGMLMLLLHPSCVRQAQLKERQGDTAWAEQAYREAVMLLEGNPRASRGKRAL